MTDAGDQEANLGVSEARGGTTGSGVPNGIVEAPKPESTVITIED